MVAGVLATESEVVTAIAIIAMVVLATVLAATALAAMVLAATAAVPTEVQLTVVINLQAPQDHSRVQQLQLRESLRKLEITLLKWLSTRTDRTHMPPMVVIKATSQRGSNTNNS
jgi:hypothetical protein